MYLLTFSWSYNPIFMVDDMSRHGLLEMRELNIYQVTVDKATVLFCETKQQIQKLKANKQKAHSNSLKLPPSEGLD